jgi:hypothetical protein
MIIAIWFTVIFFIMLVGFGLVLLTFRHWYRESRKKVQNEAALPESAV